MRYVSEASSDSVIQRLKSIRLAVINKDEETGPMKLLLHHSKPLAMLSLCLQNPSRALTPVRRSLTEISASHICEQALKRVVGIFTIE